jgi:hypothetical protein
VVFGEHHLRRVLLSYMSYYNGTRTHLSLNKETPISRTAERTHSLSPDSGRIASSIYTDSICDKERSDPDQISSGAPPYDFARFRRRGLAAAAACWMVPIRRATTAPGRRMIGRRNPRIVAGCRQAYPQPSCNRP